MATYIVTRMAYFSDQVEIEANSANEALEIAAYSSMEWERTFVETDHYEVIGIVTSKDNNSKSNQDASNIQY